MHLLVLSAFRLDMSLKAKALFSGLNAPSGAQCFPTGTNALPVNGDAVSQCTFWCSVLSDYLTSLPDSHTLSLNAPSGAQCFPTPPPENRATTPFTGTKSPPTWKAPHRIGSHLSN